MAIPAAIRARAEKQLKRFCIEFPPDAIRHKLGYVYEWRGDSVTLIEKRPSFRDRSKWTRSIIAQFRCIPSRGGWLLYWKRHTGVWYHFDQAPPADSLQPLLRILKKHPLFLG